MLRGTPLVPTIARIVQLTGTQELANLEAAGELDLPDLLVVASDAIYDQLQADGVDPTALTNELVLERAVAWHLLGILAHGGYLGVPEGLAPPASPYEWSDPHYQRVRPEVAGDTARRANEGLPAVGNLYEGWHYGGGASNRQDRYASWLPRRLR